MKSVTGTGPDVLSKRRHVQAAYCRLQVPYLQGLGDIRLCEHFVTFESPGKVGTRGASQKHARLPPYNCPLRYPV
jgi:hypothetical protein